MKHLLLIALSLLFISCSKPNSILPKYAIGYAASVSDRSDGIAIVTCTKPVDIPEAKIIVQQTVLKLENIKLDTADINIIEIKPISDKEIDPGHRDAKLVCNCMK